MMDNGLAPSIRRLDEDVVRRIAAGEVIQRPANALKELIENSIDAGATNITVTVKDGGLKMLQVADNGHGIKEVDFPLLCERHATSKLSSFADLEGIQTLGFRGEALASISYVSHVTVTSQTVGSALGLRASFHDGCMDGAPAPCAGVQGTTILAEDLFYNAPLRRKAMRGAGEEYALILEAAGAHALHSPGVAFVCRRAGEPRAELQTLGSGSRRDAVRALYGHSAARSLLDLAFAEEPEGLSPRAGAAAGLSCAVSGLMTGPEYSGKKLALVLFVNGRPVESGVLKRAVEAGYSAVLPKGVNPFVFLQVQVPPAHVDVNTHPTKRSVRLLHQAELAERLREAVQNLLLSSNDARAFVQSQMPGAPAVEEEARTAPSAYYRPEKLVRVDARAQTLHAFLTPAGGEGRGWGGSQGAKEGTEEEEKEGPGRLEEMEGPEEMESPEEEEDGEHDEQPPSMPLPDADHSPPSATPSHQSLVAPPRRRADRAQSRPDSQFAFMPTPMEIAGGSLTPQPVPPAPAPLPVRSLGPSKRWSGRVELSHSASELDSVGALLEKVGKKQHRGLSQVLSSHSFVGLADAQRALLQHGTRLFLVDLRALSEDLFYQVALRGFGSFARLAMDPPLRLKDLALLALELETRSGTWTAGAAEGSAEEVAALLERLLEQKAALLEDHFGIVIRDGMLEALPQLLPHYVPAPDNLPAFALALGRDVVWDGELECFDSLCKALARLFAWSPTSAPDAATRARDASEKEPDPTDVQTPSLFHPVELDALQEAEAPPPGPDPSQPKLGTESAQDEAAAWTVAHVLLPSLRASLKPPRHRATDGSVVELTRLERLYRVFERC